MTQPHRPRGIRVPRVTTTKKTTKVHLTLDAELYTMLQAYAEAYTAQYGDAIPLPTLMVAMIRDYLQNDRGFAQHRRQTSTPPALGLAREGRNGR
jgi:hypothetical protein